MTNEASAADQSNQNATPDSGVGAEVWRRFYGEALSPAALEMPSRSQSVLRPSSKSYSRRSPRSIGRSSDGSSEIDDTISPWPSPRLKLFDTPLHDLPEDLESRSLMFNDGVRPIDLVLVWGEGSGVGEGEEVAESRRAEKRTVFQRNLAAEGLHLELEDKQNSFDKKTYFVKIHVPWRVMGRYAEIMNLKMPTKRFITVSSSTIAWDESESIETSSQNQAHKPASQLSSAATALRLASGRVSNVAEPSFMASSAAGRPREEKFVVKDREVEYTSAQRSQVAWQILLRCRYDDHDKDKIGIRRLLNNETYLAAFPLHEGRYDEDPPPGVPVLDRRILFEDWARAGAWYRKQPLWLIRKYFGDKIGLYFAWLGFYTEMLVPAAIVGLLCFIYGCLSLGSQDNEPSREICNLHAAGNLTLCPLCDKACDYQLLKDSCFFAQLTYLFDNPATVFFAIFMSFWATSFLELWKRRQAVIAWEWDLQHVDDEQEPRPEFEASVKTFRINPVTGRREPFLPAWSRALRLFATGSMVLFMVCVVLCAVLGTIIYRLSVVSVMYGNGGAFLKRHAKIVTSMSAAVINLVIIMILTKFYHRLALWLTNLENPRTQTEYEDSFTFKIFVFEFMNFYSSLIYIAFFKGRFFVHPGDVEARRTELLRLKGDVCDPAGCLSELCIQLAIIMVGKQGLNNCVELLLPKLENWYRKRGHRAQTEDKSRVLHRWEQDYQLQDSGRLALFQEYLEMVLQYGFVTLFVAAFPLAPLFALLNNVFEIRLDAYKMLTQARRPLAERVEDIGAWYGILQGVTYAAVVSNAFVIAYTSDFIPRMVFKVGYSANFTLEGYIQSSLSAFNTSDYLEDMGADTSSSTPPSVCWYRGYRNPPGTPNQYDLSPQYWHVFAARLAFVVVFEHIVSVLTGIMAYAIPDVPSEVKTQIQRERLLAREAKFESRRRELSRSASEGTPAHHSNPAPLFSGRNRRSTLQQSLWEVA